MRSCRSHSKATWSAVAWKANTSERLKGARGLAHVWLLALRDLGVSAKHRALAAAHACRSRYAYKA
jgi:hypothetical protein